LTLAECLDLSVVHLAEDLRARFCKGTVSHGRTTGRHRPQRLDQRREHL